MLTVLGPGAFGTVQDRGRPGLAHLGVSPSGAADVGAHDLANRMVGNHAGAATLEATLGGLTVRTDVLAWVCVTGAATEVEVDGPGPAAVTHPTHTLLALRPGQRLTVRAPATGLRSYLAVRGGIAVPTVLGSRAYDALSGLGPAPLRAGDALPVGTATHPLPGVETAPQRPRGPTLAITPGPRRDWFADDAWATLLTTAYAVTPDVDRVAVRLDGAPLRRRDQAELPSEGLVRGAVQVPPSGQPLVFGADHPVTGGYPVVAVLTRRAADVAAQLRPGDQVRFVGATHH